MAALVPACGGDGDGAVSKEEYERRSSAVAGELAQALDVPLETTEQRQDAASRVAAAMRSAADDMDAIQPPEDIAEPHDAYVDTLRTCSGRFEDTLARDAPKDEVFADLLNLPCVADLDESLSAIRDAGYSIDDPL